MPRKEIAAPHTFLSSLNKGEEESPCLSLTLRNLCYSNKISVKSALRRVMEEEEVRSGLSGRSFGRSGYLYVIIFLTGSGI